MASEDIQRKADKVASIAAKADKPAHEGSQLLQGKIPSDDSKNLGHPIHPATVHWPIAVSFLMFILTLHLLSYRILHRHSCSRPYCRRNADQLLDSRYSDSDSCSYSYSCSALELANLQFLSTTFTATALTSLPSTYYPSALLPAQIHMPGIAHYTAAAAVITAIPAIITGLGEGYELIRNQYLIKGSWGKVVEDAWGMKDEGGRKVYMTVKHASMNDAVVALAGFNWYVFFILWSFVFHSSTLLYFIPYPFIPDIDFISMYRHKRASTDE